MKIIFLSPSLNKKSGGTRIITKYAHLLAKRGHKVLVVVRDKSFFRRGVFNLFQIKKPNWMKDFKARIIRVENFTDSNIPNADIIVASAWQHAEVLNDFSAKKGKKFYLIQHDERLYHGERQKVEKTYKYNLHKIAVSSWLKQRIESEFSSPVDLLLNSVDKEYFFPVDKVQDSSITILMQHHTYKWKGVNDGLRVISNVREKYPNIKLIMFGARQKEIDTDCDEYYFDPPQEKITELYSRCDIFLCPSWDEGFGLPSLQTLACRRALVTYDNGGSWDFAFDGKTAFVAKRKDIDDLTEKLELAVRDKALREKIAQQGYDYYKTMPTWDEQAEKLEKIFANEFKKYA